MFWTYDCSAVIDNLSATQQLGRHKWAATSCFHLCRCFFFFFISGHCALSQERETAVTCQPERSSRQQRVFKAYKLVSLWTAACCIEVVRPLRHHVGAQLIIRNLLLWLNLVFTLWPKLTLLAHHLLPRCLAILTSASRCVFCLDTMSAYLYILIITCQVVLYGEHMSLIFAVKLWEWLHLVSKGTNSSCKITVPLGGSVSFQFPFRGACVGGFSFWLASCSTSEG